MSPEGGKRSLLAVDKSVGSHEVEVASEALRVIGPWLAHGVSLCRSLGIEPDACERSVRFMRTDWVRYAAPRLGASQPIGAVDTPERQELQRISRGRPPASCRAVPMNGVCGCEDEILTFRNEGEPDVDRCGFASVGVRDDPEITSILRGK